MDQCTHEVRAEYWKGIIKACGQRSVGQSAKSGREIAYIEQPYFEFKGFLEKYKQEAPKNITIVNVKPLALTKDEMIKWKRFLSLLLFNNKESLSPMHKKGL